MAWCLDMLRGTFTNCRLVSAADHYTFRHKCVILRSKSNLPNPLEDETFVSKCIADSVFRQVSNH